MAEVWPRSKEGELYGLGQHILQFSCEQLSAVGLKQVSCSISSIPMVSKRTCFTIGKLYQGSACHIRRYVTAFHKLYSGSATSFAKAKPDHKQSRTRLRCLEWLLIHGADLNTPTLMWLAKLPVRAAMNGSKRCGSREITPSTRCGPADGI